MESFAQAIKRKRAEDRAGGRTVKSERRTASGRIRRVLPFSDERLMLAMRGVTADERDLTLGKCDGCDTGYAQVVTLPLAPTPKVDSRGTADVIPLRVCLDCFPRRQEVRDQKHRMMIAAIARNKRAKAALAG